MDVLISCQYVILFYLKRLGPTNGVTEKVESSDKNGRLYDKAGKVRKIRHEQKEADGEGMKLKDNVTRHSG